MASDSEYLLINKQSDLSIINSPKLKNTSAKEIFVYVSGLRLFTQLLSDQNLLSTFRTLIAFRHVDVKITLANDESLNWNGTQEQIAVLRSLLDRGITGKIGSRDTWMDLTEFAAHLR